MNTSKNHSAAQARKIASRGLLTVLVALGLTPFGAARKPGITPVRNPSALTCGWTSLPGGGANCSTSTCTSTFCAADSTSASTTECYAGGYSPTGCCICTWFTVTCKCNSPFGSSTSTGRSASSYFYPGGACMPLAGAKYECQDPYGGHLPSPEPVISVTE